MKKNLLLIFLIANLGAAAQEGVGRWRDALDYSRVNRVVQAGDLIYAAASNALFSVDTYYGNVESLSKTNLLSDAGIATIAYDEATECLAVAYTNSNLDLLFGRQVYNLSDIKRSEIAGDKQIYDIRFRQGLAYLATGFGIVVVDVRRHEIKETLYIGQGGGYTTVYALCFGADSLYAATSEGLKRIAIAERNYAVSDRWHIDTRMEGRTITRLEWFGEQLLTASYADDPDSITLHALTPTTIKTWDRGAIRTLRVSSSQVIVCHDLGVALYDASLQLSDSLSTTQWADLECPDGIITSNGTLWLGHTWAGLICINPDRTEDYYKPAGPFNDNNVYRLIPFNYSTMLCPGGHTSVYAKAYVRAGLPICIGSTWHDIENANGMMDGLSDVVDAVVNPFDTTETLAAIWGYGVASIRNRQVQQIYNTESTAGALHTHTVGDYSVLLTGAMQFDRQGRLWVLQSHVSNALACRETDGTWRSFYTLGLDPAPQVDKLVYDSLTGYLWFCGRDNVIYVHDGESRMAKVNPNNNSKLTTESVNALVQDRSGNLWLGTNKGIKVIYDAYNAFKNGGQGEYAPVSCSNITITNGEFYEYLMAYESITAIAVDGANRKWVGTSTGGLYLISSNGLEQLQHFTAENSPLLSNKIICLSVQPRTGEIFIGTDKGLQVYRADATYAEAMPWDKVRIFPNPVEPGYDGPIAINGLTRDGLVHITDAAGHTVYTTQSLGGQATWNGCTLQGKAVASGVYFVFAADGEGNNRSVGKILIIR